MCSCYRQHDRGRGKGEGEAKCERTGPVLSHHRQCDGERGADDKQFHRPETEDQFAHLPQAVEAQFQTDCEQQENDPELGERLQCVGIGYGYMIQPGVLEHHAPQAIGADCNPDKDKADDRRHAKTREDRDDQPRRAKDDERVRNRRACKFSGCHRIVRNRAALSCHDAITR